MPVVIDEVEIQPPPVAESPPPVAAESAPPDPREIERILALRCARRERVRAH